MSHLLPRQEFERKDGFIISKSKNTDVPLSQQEILTQMRSSSICISDMFNAKKSDRDSCVKSANLTMTMMNEQNVTSVSTGFIDIVLPLKVPTSGKNIQKRMPHGFVNIGHIRHQNQIKTGTY